MSIEWREAMCIGHPDIDADHKHLIMLINEFEEAIGGASPDPKHIAHVLLGLVNYTGSHFAREEEIQRQARYPFADSHCRQHRDVLKKLGTLLQEYSESKGEIRSRMVGQMTTFLKEWLIDHILESDLRMRPFVLQMLNEQKEAARRRRLAAAQGHDQPA